MKHNQTLLQLFRQWMAKLYIYLKAAYFRQTQPKEKLVHMVLDHKPALLDTCICHLGRLMYIGRDTYIMLDNKEEYLKQNIKTDQIPFIDFSNS